MGKVEGITLDLTRIPESGEYTLEDLIVHDISGYSASPFPDWLCELYNNPCAFCGKKRIKMHFDHINMFEKTDCISTMHYKGYSKEEIIAEIDKCQLLCIHCHKKVTRTEIKHGFFKKKRIFNKILRKGGDISELRTKLIAEYSEIMGVVYGELRGTGKGGYHEG